MSADARRAGPARQRAAAAWLPRAAPTRARIKRCRDGAASRQHPPRAAPRASDSVAASLHALARPRRARRSDRRLAPRARQTAPRAAHPFRPRRRRCPSAPPRRPSPRPRRRLSPPVSRHPTPRCQRAPASLADAGAAPPRRAPRGAPRARTPPAEARLGRAARMWAAHARRARGPSRRPGRARALCNWAEREFGPVHPG